MKKDSNMDEENQDTPSNSQTEKEINSSIAQDTSSLENEKSPEEKLKEELSQSNDKYLRLYSEFENYKKRTLRDRIEFSKSVGSEIISSLLPVLDDFERAIKLMNEDKDSSAMKEGVNLIYSKFKTLLQQKGLSEMKSAGEKFDSDFHEAVANAKSADASMKGKVVEELEKGYFLNGKVIRYSKVIVGS